MSQAQSNLKNYCSSSAWHDHDNSLIRLSNDLKAKAHQLGLADIGITDIDLSEFSSDFKHWLERKYYAGMDYMHKHGDKRWKPEKLIENTCRVISFRLDYWPEHKTLAHNDVTLHPVLQNSEKAYISRYALGRDYHKTLRQKGKKLAQWLESQLETQPHNLQYRVFVDSAPVLEKPLAKKAGLGWVGKHSNLVHPKHGSWFFLGEIYTNIPLEISSPFTKNHCGSCSRCIDVCPTKAIVAPYVVDANLCISYLTIEHHGSIPVHLREKIGNRIYGCDDCQLVCPWNSFSQTTQVVDFHARHGLDDLSLIEAISWTEQEFLSKTEGSAIRRIGYEKWQRNVAVAIGNIQWHHHETSQVNDMITILDKVLNDNTSELVKEHVQWARQQLVNHLNSK